jgi:hypothetical protein
VGIKSEILGRKAHFNLAGYIMDRKDSQIDFNFYIPQQTGGKAGETLPWPRICFSAARGSGSHRAQVRPSCCLSWEERALSFTFFVRPFAALMALLVAAQPVAAYARGYRQFGEGTTAGPAPAKVEGGLLHVTGIGPATLLHLPDGKIERPTFIGDYAVEAGTAKLLRELPIPGR